MRFTETKTLQIYSNPYWAEFTWRDGCWKYESASEGFLKHAGIPYSFTEAERFLLEIQLSDK